MARRTQQQRDEAWATASEAWGQTSHRSPADGIAERIRAARTPRPASAARRQSERDAMMRRIARAYAAERHPSHRQKDDCRYFPHQGPRECARRVRQASLSA